jgi:hypothetical protein
MILPNPSLPLPTEYVRIVCPEAVTNYIFMLHHYAAFQSFDFSTIFHLHNLLHLEGPQMHTD